jgi:hypothetical protein
VLARLLTIRAASSRHTRRPHPEEPRKRRLEGWAAKKTVATPLRPRDAFRPSCASHVALSFSQTAQGRPGGRCTRGRRAKENLRERDDHRYRRRHSGLPCAVVLRLIRTLPGEPAFATVASPIISPRSLAPAWARQDHTTSPYAKAPLVSQRAYVHRIPASRVVTTAIRPSANEAG